MSRPPPELSPPRVTTGQWGILLASLAVAAASYLTSSYGAVFGFIIALTLLNLWLLGSLLLEALRTRLLGKSLLTGGTLLFFWLETLADFQHPVPFPMPHSPITTETQFSLALVHQALVYVAVFQFMLFAGYSLRPHLGLVTSWADSRTDRKGWTSLVLKLLLAACALTPLLLSFSLDLQNVTKALLAARSGSGPAGEPVGLLHNLEFLGMFGAALLIAKGTVLPGRHKLVWLLAGAVCAAPFVFPGARHLWLFIGLPAVAIAAMRFLGRGALFRAMQWGMVAMGILLVVQLQWGLRGTGWNNIGNLKPAQLLTASSTGQFTALLYAEYLVPERHPYFMEVAEPYFVIHWIPRKFWPEKPIMRSWTEYNDSYTGGSSEFNVTPSVIGQFHINWGVLGVVFIGAWLGFLTCLADRLMLGLDLDRQQALAVVVGMLYAFILSSFRFYSPIYVTYVVFGLVGMWLITRGTPAAQKRSRRAQLHIGNTGLPRV
ncbi:MAG: hypothetical protein FJ316_06860 [SAR202 cluster bacterium]|nr:hypothetical protein [SAR202 cluster bacterium]